MIHIRQACSEDWPAMWGVMQPVIAAADTFSWDPAISEEDARARWCHDLPGRTFVAVDDDGIVVGTAESEPNHEGPGAHVATAGFMVDPERRGLGAGRALCERVIEQARADGFRAIQFNAVAESNVGAAALWRSLGFEVLATVPEAFRHPTDGYVGLHIMYLRL